MSKWALLSCFISLSLTAGVQPPYEIQVSDFKKGFGIQVQNNTGELVKCVMVPTNKKDLERKTLVKANSLSKHVYRFRSVPVLRCYAI